MKESDIVEVAGIIRSSFAEAFLLVVKGSTYLDSKNIIWKISNGNIVGKRSVWTKDNRACWIEDTPLENIKSYWCGEDADYKETFTKKNN